MIRVDKISDGRDPLPARSWYISENRGTILGKSSHARVHPAVFRTRQGEVGVDKSVVYISRCKY